MATAHMSSNALDRPIARLLRETLPRSVDWHDGAMCAKAYSRRDRTRRGAA